MHWKVIKQILLLDSHTLDFQCLRNRYLQQAYIKKYCFYYLKKHLEGEWRKAKIRRGGQQEQHWPLAGRWLDYWQGWNTLEKYHYFLPGTLPQHGWKIKHSQVLFLKGKLFDKDNYVHGNKDFRLKNKIKWAWIKCWQNHARIYHFSFLYSH